MEDSMNDTEENSNNESSASHSEEISNEYLQESRFN